MVMGWAFVTPVPTTLLLLCLLLLAYLCQPLMRLAALLPWTYKQATVTTDAWGDYRNSTGSLSLSPHILFAAHSVMCVCVLYVCCLCVRSGLWMRLAWCQRAMWAYESWWGWWLAVQSRWLQSPWRGITLRGKVRHAVHSKVAVTLHLAYKAALQFHEEANEIVSQRLFFTVAGINSGIDECISVFGINTFKHLHSHQFP